jgi:hypothetical protein
LTYLKHGVHLTRIADIENHAALVEAFKSGSFDADGVLADTHGRRAILAALVRPDLSDGGSRQMSQRDRRGLYRGLAGIENRSHHDRIANLLPK